MHADAVQDVRAFHRQGARGDEELKKQTAELQARLGGDR
jgi:hypothetical protein